MSKNKPQIRNSVLNSPLLRKGGVHQKTRKAIRREEKIKFKKEWLPKNQLFTVAF